MINRVILLRWVLGSIGYSQCPLAEIMAAQCKTVDLDANETGGVWFI